MKLPLTAALVTSAIIANAIFAVPPATGPAGTAATVDSRPNAARIPVLLELFTSEGCSSCPPADRLLESLDRQPVASADLIVLSEHVDYWNYLGWSDPYSSPLFSARQQKYSGRLGTDVYTPQLVIDGRFQALGSDRGEVMQAIDRATQGAKLPVSVRASGSGSSGSIHVEANSGGAGADLYIVLAADHARSQVLRGENGGHMLTHVAVARSITRIGKWEGSGAVARDVPIPSKELPAAHQGAQPGETRVIAILEDPKTGRVLGAAQTRF